jgi:fucose 4-O-acetylase-like acetyltransferase
VDIFKGKEAVFDLSLASPHFALWFLLSLFCWNVLLFVFARFGWWTVPVAFAIGIAIGFADDVDKYLSLSRTFVFFPFFLLGYYLKPAFFKKLTRIGWQIAGGAVLAVLLVVFYFYSPAHSTEWLECSYPYSYIGINEWQGALTRLAQYTIMVFALFSALSLMPKQHLNMTVRGRRTLYVYLLHGFIIQAIRKFVPDGTYGAVANHIPLLILFALAIAFILASRPAKKVARPLVELRV